MLQNRNGFTLIGLMLVVVIIGILAAPAVQGLMTYIMVSKTSEAKSNLKAIAEGASSFYQTEHTLKNGTVYTRQFPNSTHCKSATSIDNSCKDFNNAPSEIKPAGTKTALTLTDEPWKSLNFAVTAPVYYTYSYKGAASTDSAASSFSAQAAAKLDSANVDSCFTMDGNGADNGEPTISVIKDKSEVATGDACAVFSK